MPGRNLLQHPNPLGVEIDISVNCNTIHHDSAESMCYSVAKRVNDHVRQFATDFLPSPPMALRIIVTGITENNHQLFVTTMPSESTRRLGYILEPTKGRHAVSGS